MQGGIFTYISPTNPKPIDIQTPGEYVFEPPNISWEDFLGAKKQVFGAFWDDYGKATAFNLRKQDPPNESITTSNKYINTAK